ncbi:glycerol-3-phosphate 1-O-acyltransferase PlsY [Palleronia sp. KMU-117]|uniref:glycerol-3-phosphate 1-O-acyltransferase PlsY n=1 Tax=Palleronia sp. KMU-117 TaxID=3434108 RepID=UPI003D7126B0
MIVPDLTSPPLALIAVALFGYLLGSIPFGVVVTRAMGLGDVRQIGSGNIGATNVLRTGNRLAAFLTFALDAAKGGVAVLIARASLGEDAAQVAGGFAFLGHLFPVWLGFRGGKGVATFIGTVLALNPAIGLAACATWLAAAALSRISSVGGLAAAALSPVWAWLLGDPQTIALLVGLTVLIYIRHAANIRRILDGTEPRIGKKT